MSKEENKVRSGFRTRAMAFGFLAGFAALVGYLGQQSYRAVTDSFVAPIILSPDNDLVLTSELKVAEFQVERARTVAEMDAIDHDLEACEKAIARLRGLQATASKGLAWTTSVQAQQATAGSIDLATLARERSVLEEMLKKQEALTKSAEANAEAGLVSRTDVAKEVQALHQLRLALLEHDRTRVQANLQMQQLTLAQRSLANASGAPPMPELLVREDQLVRIELEVLRLESEQRTKGAERKVLAQKLAKIDEMEQKLKGRPIFRAIESRMDVAFVPYTQIDGVAVGADVYDCVWGLFHCKRVGKVTEVVPGEVILPDPWGNQARGQYAVMSLSDHDSAKSKTLRIRGGASSSQPVSTDRSDQVSAR